MAHRGIFPRQEGDMNVYFQTAVAYLLLNVGRLLLTPDNETAIKSKLANWMKTYPLTKSKSTATKTATENKDEARDEMKTTLRDIYLDFPASILTKEDRATMNITERSLKYARVQKPSTTPEGWAEGGNRLQHIIHFLDSASGKKGKPDGVTGCEVWMKLDTEPLDVSELTYLGSCSGSPFTNEFTGTDAGKNAFYWLRWVNNRKEVGGWGNQFSATVAG